MSEQRITCVKKPNRTSKHEHITEVGLENGRKLTVPQVIQLINSRASRFFTLVNGNKAYVGVVNDAQGRPWFIRTYADRVWNDNLLALPECVP
jgi:hypothetical protein